MEIQEGRLQFSFPDTANAVKFDDTAFYRNFYEKAAYTKGLDIVANCNGDVYLIEVKDCSKTAEDQDKWRRAYNGNQNMDTLAQEIAEKVAHTCACLMGVQTYGERKKQSTELQPIAAGIISTSIPELRKKLFVLLYLEGDFSTASRSNKMIRREIRQRIERKLQWLNGRIDVVSTELHKAHAFGVQLTQ